MGRKLLKMVTLWLLAVPLAAAAQNGSVVGRVTDGGTGEALPGANVYLLEVKRGASSDIDGKYVITNVPAGSYTIIASYIGYKQFKADVQVSGDDVVFDIALKPDPLGLDELVVTAQGVQREKRAVGYAITTVKSDAVVGKGESDVVRSLNGKVPGVEILQTSGVAGTGTSFNIRGFNTITGNTQPLFIVDGVQFDISTVQNTNFADGGASTSSSRFLDIDPNNIADMSVLKGIAATTIYGEQGRNGVVIITTKGGAAKNQGIQGFDINISQSYFQSTIASLPDYQTKYGIGTDQNFGYFFSNWGPAFNPDESEQEPMRRTAQWMGVENGTIYLTHPYIANLDQRLAFPEFVGAKYAFKDYDNVGQFFRDGVNNNTAVNVSGSASGVGINLSLSSDDNNGFVSGNNVSKTNFGLGLNFDATDKLTFRATVNSSKTDFSTPPISAGLGSGVINTSSGLSVFSDVFYTPRAIDLMNMPYENPANGVSAYYRAGNDIQNPRWTVANTRVMEAVDRYFGKAEAQYKILKELNLTYKVGLDTWTSRRQYRANKGLVQNNQLRNGIYQTEALSNRVVDQSVLLSYNKLINKSISVTGLLGGQYVRRTYQSDGLESQSQLTRGLFEHSNFTTPSSTNYFSGSDFQYQQEVRNLGVFGDFSIGYNDYLYFNVAGRQDYFSTHEPEFNNLFYPSFSVSFIPTEMLKMSGTLSYLKLRAGIGQSAGAAGPYNTRNVLAATARNFVTSNGTVVTTNAVSNFLGNPTLKPERVTEREFGIESRFFNDKLGLDVTYFNRTTTDQIVSADLDPSTGFTSTLTNIGEIETNGLEVAYNFTPMQSGKFKWNVSGNFYTFKSMVNKLGNGITEIPLAGFTDLYPGAIEGKALNTMKGTQFKRDSLGRKLVGEDGYYIESDEIGVIGNPAPKYTTSLTNAFSWNGLTFSFQFNYQHGGDIYSRTVGALMARGVTTDTDFDRQRTIILPGIREATGEANDIQMSAFNAFFGNHFGPSEGNVYDATILRLQEMTVSYDLPGKMVKSIGLKGASIVLSGTNLWYWTPNIPKGTNFDPQVSALGVGTARGFDFVASPTVRRFGGTVRLKL